jgi:hypothetical protein
MNWIKKIITGTALLLALNLSAQNQMTIYPHHFNTWVQSNPTCAGCGSFFVMVVDEKTKAKDGHYYSYVYLWSNSYYTTSYAASSYIKNIQLFFVYGDKEYKAVEFNYALVPPKSNDFNGWFQLAYLYNSKLGVPIKIKWSEVNVW